MRCEPPLDVGLVDGAGEVVRRQSCRDVEQGSGCARDREVVAAGDVGGIEPGDAVEADARAVAGVAAGEHDVDRAGTRCEELPYRGRGEMAQHRAIAGGEDRRLRPRPWRLERADQEDAAMEAHEPPRLHAMRDRLRGQTRLDQLRRGHDTVLATRQLGDPPIRAYFVTIEAVREGPCHVMCLPGA
jgi:hypothetical protein